MSAVKTGRAADWKLAVTVRGAESVTDWGFVVPVRSPLQPVNWLDALAVAVNRTEVPLA
jgi:hypothetical protein